jgi:hypothetical protein
MGQNVSGRRVSISVVMKLTAIVALILTLVRVVPDFWFFTVPPFLFVIILLDLALLQAVAFGQPLRIFYFTYLIVGVLSTGVITVLAIGQPRSTSVTLHILETAIQYYRSVRGQSSVIPPYIKFPVLAAADQWITCILVGLLPALTAAPASWWMRRRCQRRSEWRQALMTFLQGALIGFGLYVGAAMVVAFSVASWLLSPPAALTYIFVAGFAASPLLVSRRRPMQSSRSTVGSCRKMRVLDVEAIKDRSKVA